METAEIIFSALGVLFILLAAFGAMKLNRRNFLLGIFLFSLLPIIGEFQAYSSTGEWGMLATMMAFLGIAIVTLPVKAQYGSDNIAATSIAKKIGLAIMAVNLFQAYIILSVRDDVPSQYGYMHIVVAAVVIYMVVKSNSSKGFSWN
jgi:peptidoglycan/LPS O-acetylase OafA/YrhL